MRFAWTLPAFALVLSSSFACDSSDAADDDGGESGRAGQAGSDTSGGSGGSATGGGAGTSASGQAGSSGGATTGGGAGTGGASGASGTAAGGAGTGAGGASGGENTGGNPVGGAGSGAAGSGGSDAAAGGTAGTAGTASVDPCASALYCDDFESYTTGQAPSGKWTTRMSSGTVVVDETRHVSGSKAVKFATTGNGSSKTAFLRIQDASVFPAPNNTFYGRMLFYLEAAPTTSVHWTFVQGGGLIEGQSYHALYRYGGQQPVSGGNQLMANYETPDSYSGTGPGSDCWHHSNGKTVPVETWTCVEWKFDGENNEMRFWLDGVALDDLTVSGTGQGCVNQDAGYPWTAPNFSELELGCESYQTDTERTAYIDDVVISATQVGCPE